MGDVTTVDVVALSDRFGLHSHRSATLLMPRLREVRQAVVSGAGTLEQSVAVARFDAATELFLSSSAELVESELAFGAQCHDRFDTAVRACSGPYCECIAAVLEALSNYDWVCDVFQAAELLELTWWDPKVMAFLAVRRHFADAAVPAVLRPNTAPPVTTTDLIARRSILGRTMVSLVASGWSLGIDELVEAAQALCAPPRFEHA